MAELVIEIGTEEIPSGYVEPALQYLERELAAYFEKNRVQAGSARVMGTPRRLLASFSGMEVRQRDVVETCDGPSVKIAFDAQGAPTRAAIGFARGKGVDVGSLTRKTTAKGEIVCARVEKKGEPTRDLLNAFLSRLISGIPFPKKMRWGNKHLLFARPVHWIAALFDGRPLDFELDGLHCGDASRGHRFLKPEAFRFDSLETYLKQCEAHFVLVDPQVRKREIWDAIQTLARGVGGLVREEPELLREVTYLVEFPTPLLCDFETEYLSLPKELLTITMKHHQKYFPVSRDNGDLMPHFITVSNMKPGSGDVIKRGNERVLKARLEDARFFYNEDRKKKLEDYVELLKGVVFQKTLGTSHEKMTRFRTLAGTLAQKVCPQALADVDRAALLCKADLVTQMVYEFPELQGVMGSYYAAHSGENETVARAVREHYCPAFAGDALPSDAVGAVVAVADKMDTILGCIGVRLIPSGSEDPYGLRRHSLGIIQIILDRGWRISLNELIDAGTDLLREKIKLTREEIRSHTLDLFLQRLKTYFGAAGYPYDAVDAVLSTGIDFLVDVDKKVAAFSALKQQSHFEPLAITFRRVVSILTEEAQGAVQPELLSEPQEKHLYEHYLKIREPVEHMTRQSDFSGALAKIVEIKSSVDDFFDHVMVMVDDAALRKNRLCLLHDISLLFSRLADFSRIVLKKS
ncbi:MAG: glycine--tRNA ligase subunit beta [Nitrospinales bacterium]